MRATPRASSNSRPASCRLAARDFYLNLTFSPEKIMYPQNNELKGAAEPATYPLGQPREQLADRQAMALLALSHTPVEHELYLAMRAETDANRTSVAAFSVRRLMLLSGISGYSTIRRGLSGLMRQLSIEREDPDREAPNRNSASIFRAFLPGDVFAT